MDMQEKTKEQWLSQGIAYLNEQKNEKALVACMRARQVDPFSPRAHHGIGLVCERLGLYIDAQISYEKALQLDLDNPKLNFDMANFLYNRGDYNRSREYYIKAGKLDPKYNRYYYERVKNCENYETMQVLAGDDASVNYGIANILYERGEYKIAGEIYRSIIKSNPKYENNYRGKIAKLLAEGQSWENSQDYDTAIDIYEKKLLMFAPNNQTALSNIRACGIKKASPGKVILYPELTVHPFNCRCAECYEP